MHSFNVSYMQSTLGRANRGKKMGRTVTFQPDKVSRVLLERRLRQLRNRRGAISEVVNAAIRRALADLASKMEQELA